MKGKKVRPITPKVQVTPKKPKPKYVTLAQTKPQECDTFEGASSTCAICGFSANKKEKKKSALRGELKFHPCVASVCLKCLQHAMDQQYACGITQVFCPLCLRPFTDSERGRIHPDLNNRISEQMTLSNLGNVVECRFCSNKFLFEPTSADVAKKGLNTPSKSPEVILRARSSLLSACSGLHAAAKGRATQVARPMHASLSHFDFIDCPPVKFMTVNDLYI